MTETAARWTDAGTVWIITNPSGRPGAVLAREDLAEKWLAGNPPAAAGCETQAWTVLGDGPAAEPKPGRRARVEVKGFRDLGIVRVTETTLAGEPMLHAECDDGSSADFPPSSLHFITWLPDGALAPATRAALPPSRGGFDPEHEFSDDEDDADPEDGMVAVSTEDLSVLLGLTSRLEGRMTVPEMAFVERLDDMLRKLEREQDARPERTPGHDPACTCALCEGNEGTEGRPF